MQLLDRARSYLAKCPPAISGAGGHNTTFTVAVALTHGFNLSRADATMLLKEYNLKCSPAWSDNELNHKINEAIKTEHDKPAGHLANADNNKPNVSPSGKFIIRRIDSRPAQSNLSKVDATKAFLNAVFNEHDWICITTDARFDEQRGKWFPASSGTFMSRGKWLDMFPDSMWNDKPQGAWIRINPTNTDRYDGSDSNVSAYRHVLIEFDELPKDQQLAIITECRLPISCVIDSGGRSLHAWVKVDATNKEEWESRRDTVYEYLSDYNPCESNKNPSRFSRLAGIMRGDTEQKLVSLKIGFDTWEEWIDWRDQNEITEPNKPSELLAYDTDNDPNNILGRRWLCKGGSLTIVGQSGIGKSSFAMQMALTFALGKNFFGITPIKPLRIALVQAENDIGDLSEAFKGVVSAMHISNAEMQLLDENIRFYDETVKTGDEFIRLARSIIIKHKADMIFVDPLLSYAGDDISEQKFMSSFLRNKLNPVLQDTGCVWVWLHHMPKPKNDQQAGTLSDMAYAGAGSADLTNWSREVAVLKREEKDLPVFSFTLTKRGKRAGMTGLDGKPTTSVRLKHSESGICWEYSKFVPIKPKKSYTA